MALVNVVGGEGIVDTEGGDPSTNGPEIEGRALMDREDADDELRFRLTSRLRDPVSSFLPSGHP